MAQRDPEERLSYDCVVLVVFRLHPMVNSRNLCYFFRFSCFPAVAAHSPVDMKNGRKQFLFRPGYLWNNEGSTIYYKPIYSFFIFIYHRRVYCLCRLRKLLEQVGSIAKTAEGKKIL